MAVRHEGRPYRHAHGLEIRDARDLVHVLEHAEVADVVHGGEVADEPHRDAPCALVGGQRQVRFHDEHLHASTSSYTRAVAAAMCAAVWRSS